MAALGGTIDYTKFYFTGDGLEAYRSYHADENELDRLMANEDSSAMLKFWWTCAQKEQLLHSKLSMLHRDERAMLELRSVLDRRFELWMRVLDGLAFLPVVMVDSMSDMHLVIFLKDQPHEWNGSVLIMNSAIRSEDETFSIRKLAIERRIGIFGEERRNDMGRMHICTISRAGEGQICTGVVLRNSLGGWVMGFSTKYCKEEYSTIYMSAELSSIWKGLYVAWDAGYRKLLVGCESQDIINELVSPLSGSNHLRHCELNRWKKFIRRYGSCIFEQVKRENNRLAEYWANLCHDGKVDARMIHLRPPLPIVSVLNDEDTTPPGFSYTSSSGSLPSSVPPVV